MSGKGSSTRVYADTHVHLYPRYDLATALASLAGNLGRGAARADARLAAGFFTERRDCRLFADLRSGALIPPGSPFEVRPGSDPETALLVQGARVVAHLFAGRQIVTAERIEILALATLTEIPDGKPAGHVVDAVLASGGVPVVGWSPGKWWFARGRVIRELLRTRRPGELLLGDTAMRPAGSPEPRLMREGRAAGFSVIAGTDALPFAGEERLLGSYGSLLQGPFSVERPLGSVRELLRSPAAVVGTSGARSTWAGAARRWWGNASAGRRAAG